MTKFIRDSKYGLPDIPVGGTKQFHDLDEKGRKLIKRSAHNYNVRTNLYFSLRDIDGVLYVTRIR